MFGESDTDFSWADQPATDAPLLAPSSPEPIPTPEPEKLPQDTSQLPAPAAQAPVPMMTDAAARRGAGIALLLAGTGAAIGWAAGGGWGAGAGLTLVGALRNGARAKSLWASQVPAEREEAAKSATMAVVGAAIGGYFAYRAVRNHNSIQAEE